MVSYKTPIVVLIVAVGVWNGYMQTSCFVSTENTWCDWSIAGFCLVSPADRMQQDSQACFAALSDKQIRLDAHMNAGVRAVDSFSIVARHAQFFAGADWNSNFTWPCMRYAHATQGFGVRSLGVDLKIRAILNLLDARNVSRNARSLVRVVNPESTGIWDVQGRFSESTFRELQNMAIDNHGKHIVTEATFRKLRQQTRQTRLNELRNWDMDWLDIPTTATYIGHVLPVTWKQVTDGSIREMLSYYGDHEYVDSQGTKHPAMTIERAEAFYRDPVGVMLDTRKVHPNGATKPSGDMDDLVLFFTIMFFAYLVPICLVAGGLLLSSRRHDAEQQPRNARPLPTLGQFLDKRSLLYGAFAGLTSEQKVGFHLLLKPSDQAHSFDDMVDAIRKLADVHEVHRDVSVVEAYVTRANAEDLYDLWCVADMSTFGVASID